MLVRRINGLHPAMCVRDEMDKLFNGLLENAAAGMPLAGLGRRCFPAVNVWEDGENLFAEVEIPGLKMENLEVLVLGDELTIKGTRSESNEEGVRYHRRERGTGDFSRVVRLPVEIDADKVRAALRDGVLTITLPKAPAVLPRKIPVKS